MNLKPLFQFADVLRSRLQGVAAMFRQAAIAMAIAMAALMPMLGSSQEAFKCVESGATVYKDKQCSNMQSRKPIDGLKHDERQKPLPMLKNGEIRDQIMRSIEARKVKTAHQVERCWAFPRKKNSTITSQGTRQQWVYDRS